MLRQLSFPMIQDFLSRHTTGLPVLALLLATFFWGSSFITVGSALDYTNPLTLMLMRFGVGSVMVAALLRGRIFAIPAKTWRAGAVCGLAIYLAYAFNAAGLMTLESSVSGFLTALYVPLTPLMVWVVYGRRPSAGALVGVLMAFGGLVLLANPFTLTLSGNPGELMTILSAFLSAGEIMIVSRFAPGTQARHLAFTQLVSVTVFSLLGLGLAEAVGLPLGDTVLNQTVILAVLWLAVIVACVQVLLSWAQRYVPAGRAAVIFAMESVFCAIIGWFAGEDLGWTGLLGGALIVSGILAGEIQWKKRKEASS